MAAGYRQYSLREASLLAGGRRLESWDLEPALDWHRNGYFLSSGFGLLRSTLLR